MDFPFEGDSVVAKLGLFAFLSAFLLLKIVEAVSNRESTIDANKELKLELGELANDFENSEFPNLRHQKNTKKPYFFGRSSARITPQVEERTLKSPLASRDGGVNNTTQKKTQSAIKKGDIFMLIQKNPFFTAQ